MRILKAVTLGAALFLAGCATHIQPPAEQNVAAKAKLGTFAAVSLAALKVEKMEGDSGDQRAVEYISDNLKTCMSGIFPKLAEQGNGGKGLLVEPIITDLKKVNVAERVFLGPMAGASAVLLKVRYTDLATQQVVAEPIFYAKANSMGAAMTFGTTDNLMLLRVVNNACDYARQNL